MIDKEIRELFIAIIYVDDIYFINSKDFSLFLKLKLKFMIK